MILAAQSGKVESGEPGEILVGPVPIAPPQRHAGYRVMRASNPSSPRSVALPRSSPWRIVRVAVETGMIDCAISSLSLRTEI
jgi:hypothetical protein